MSILPRPPCPVPTVSPSPPGRILLVRISLVRSQGRRHSNYVTIEASPDDSDADLFVKAVREYRHRHGPTECIAAIDLLPNS